jgi:hypothetical protein
VIVTDTLCFPLFVLVSCVYVLTVRRLGCDESMELLIKFPSPIPFQPGQKDMATAGRLIVKGCLQYKLPAEAE